MDLKLNRTEKKESGIFGELYDGEGNLIAFTIEHAYQGIDGNYVPKVAPGEYQCVRHAPNRLPYETFMLECVPDFDGKQVTGILIHKGNFNKDSVGCILVGSSRDDKMIMNSGKTFKKFMDMQSGVDSFTITISEGE